MKTELLGDGNPEYAVVSCIHGEESCGWEAVQKFKESEYELREPLKVILANEKAFELGERYVDVDMNRVFLEIQKAVSTRREWLTSLKESLKD